MPCYTQTQVEQILEGIKDLNLLAEGLREMGYSVRLIGERIDYSGTNKLDGRYSAGSYAFGRLTSSGDYAAPDVAMIKKFVGLATAKKHLTTHKWTIKPIVETRKAKA
jgi:hypothetical protein